MPEKFGIDVLEKIFDFGVLLGKDVVADLKDGKLTINEILALVMQLSAIPGLIENKQAIIDQAGDLSIAEIESLVRRGGEAINNAKVKSVIEHAIMVTDGITGLIQDFKPAPAVPPTV